MDLCGNKSNTDKWHMAEWLQRQERTTVRVWRMACTSVAVEQVKEDDVRWTATFDGGAADSPTLTLRGYGACPYVAGVHHHLQFKAWPE